jgi:hypothetical protein
MARNQLFTDVYETDTFNEWRLKTNSIKLNLADVYAEIDNFPNIAVMLTGNQTVDGIKSFAKKSVWTKEYTQNQVTPMLELRVTNSTTPHGQNIGHRGSGPSIDFYNPDTTTGGNTWLTSRIASITESNADIFPDASLVFYTGKNTKDIIEKMRITSGGNVGIGTTSPTTQLSITTATNNSVVSIRSKDDKYAGVSFGDSKSDKSGQIQYHNIGNSMRFLTGEASSNSSAERLRITSSGNVGIGTGEPRQKLDVIGNLKTTGWIEAGRETGGVALTLNDGYGNSNIAFNHSYGNPSVNGSSGRIRCDVDAAAAFMRFELGDNAIKDNKSDLSPILVLTTTKVALKRNTDIDGNLYTSGKIGIRESEPDWDLCVGNKTTEAGHVAMHADGGVISLRPKKNTTHAWLINAYDSNGGSMGVVSRKWNSTKNAYDETVVLDFYSNNSVNVKSKLAVGGFTNSSNGAPSSTKFSVRGPSDDTVSAQFRGAIQVNQFSGASRAYGFLSTNQGSAMVGGNLRLSNLTGEGGEASNVGKTATVWITCDNKYKLYHNDALIGEGTDWSKPQSHTFIVTGNDRIGVEAINTGGLSGLCYIIIVDGKVVFETNKTNIKASAGPFSTGWNVSNNLFNFGGSIPVDGTFQQIKQNLIAAVPGGDIGSAEVIWMPDGTEINRTYFFQGRFQEVTDSSYQKGTNLRGSSALQFIEGANSTGQIAFLRANDTNDDTYTVSESARFDENGRFGIGVTNPTQALDVSGNIKSSGLMFLANNGYPQLVLSDANQKTKRFGIWKENTQDQLAIGPQTTTGSGTPAIRVHRNATVDILKGGKVNVVLSDAKALVNKEYVDTAVLGADQFGDLSNLALNRTGDEFEGGQITFKRAIDNADYWHVDTYGNTNSPSLRFFHENDTLSGTTQVLNLTSTNKVGIRESDPDWDLCVGGKSTEAGSVAISATGGAISLRPTKNTTHAWMLNASDSAGGGFAVVSRELNAATNKYVDKTALSFYTNKSIVARGAFTATSTIRSNGNIIADSYLYSRNDAILGKSGDEWRLHTRSTSTSSGDFFEIARRNDANTDWNWGQGIRQMKDGSVGIGGLPAAGYKLDVNGNIQVNGTITKEGYTKPSNWSGGLTTFDIYSDGGSIGVGKDGSLECYFNREGNGYVKNKLTLGYTPSSATDAVTKAYVDSAVSGQIGNTINENVLQATGNIKHSEGVYNGVVTPSSNFIPSGVGKHSHGQHFVAKLESTNTGDGGGLFIDITDNNNDEHAVSIYNTNTSINKEVFHIRSKTGDTYSAGNFYAGGNIGAGEKFTIGDDKNNHWYLEETSNVFYLRQKSGGKTKTALTFGKDRKISLGVNGTSDSHLINKKYVDDQINSNILAAGLNHTGNQSFAKRTGETHGGHFVSKFTSTNSTDGGGILIDVTDTNGDEEAISIYNTSEGYPIFRVKSETGNTKIRGELEVGNDLTVQGAEVILPDTTGKSNWRIKKNAGNIDFNRKVGTSITTVMTLKGGAVKLAKDGTNDDELVTKKYIDDKIATTGGITQSGGTAPYYGCRAWAHYNGVTQTLAGNGNIKSVKRNAVGQYRFTFDIPMETAFYSVNASVSQEYLAGLGHTVPFIWHQTVDGFTVVSYDEDNSAWRVDKSIVNISVFA